MKLFLLIVTMLLQAPAPPRPVSGSVTGTVIVAGTAAPIPDAEIAISTAGALFETTTDANGRFSLANVPAGRHTVVIRADGFFPASAAPEAVFQLGAEVPVTVAPEASSVSVGPVAMVRGAIITGTVLDTQGRPLPFANVQALRPGPVGSLQAVAGRRTDDRGEYRLFWVPPGEYLIGVTPNPPAPANLAAAPPGGPPRIVRTLFPSTTDAAQANKVAVKSGDEARGIDISARLEVVNPPASPVTATGVAATGGVKISGQITNALMPTIGTGVLVLGSEADTTPPRQVASVALNAATVPFEIPGIPPGNYELLIRMPDARGSRGTGGAVQAWGRTTIEVRDRDIDGVQMTIHPSVDVPGILKIDGKAAPAGGNLKIGLAPLGPAGRIANYRGIVDRTQAPDQDGKFAIPGAAEANYDVFVQGAPATSYIADIRQGDASILASGIGVREAVPATIEVLLATDGGIVEGLASISTSDRRPASGATVVLVPEDRQLLRLAKTVTAGADGRYSILGVRPGEYKVFAGPPGPLPPGGLTPELLSKLGAKGINVTVKAAATTRTDVAVITD